VLISLLVLLLFSRSQLLQNALTSRIPWNQRFARRSIGARDARLAPMLRMSQRLPLKVKLLACTQCLLRHYSTGSSAQAAKPPRILFFGSDSFSVTSLEKLVETQRQDPELFKSIDIVTREPAPSGRGLQIREGIPSFRAAVTHSASSKLG